jgi:DNA-binding XRE family transcriptional regulator
VTSLVAQRRRSPPLAGAEATTSRRRHGRARNECTTSRAIALLVGQTFWFSPFTTWGVPTRPSQTDPKRARMWERRRHAVGVRIRTVRHDRDMTQEALALASGVTRNVLIDVEHGRRGLLFERLFDIADALGVPVAELLRE